MTSTRENKVFLYGPVSYYSYFSTVNFTLCPKSVLTEAHIFGASTVLRKP